VWINLIGFALFYNNVQEIKILTYFLECSFALWFVRNQLVHNVAQPILSKYF
jgi:hypothetical protein